MSLDVILPNWLIAFNSVTFYQNRLDFAHANHGVTNHVLYHSVLPERAILALVPACVGGCGYGHAQGESQGGWS
ncbi:hypothetical protein QR685DRAFT_515961 [Neurospora intermedia]|uniref:Uncharacterized protein n=1 Tax=Neurospora intermedia TaxID=5142 RepID=A0ABR3DKK2_NEUIN